MIFKTFLIVLFSIGLNNIYSQNIRVDLNMYGQSNWDEYNKKRFAMSLQKKHGNKYYTKIPIRLFNDSLILVVHKKKGQYFPYKIDCLNQQNVPWNFHYDKNLHLITISNGQQLSEMHLYNLQLREGEIKPVYNFKDETIVDTTEWLGIERKKIIYGQFSIDDRKYSITVGNSNKTNSLLKNEYFISIDTSMSMYHSMVPNSRGDMLSHIKYLDFEGDYFEIKRINFKKNYIEIQKMDNFIPSDSCIYFDSEIRATSYLYEHMEYDISDMFEEDKYIILSFWSEYCHPCIKDIPKLNKLQKTYKNEIEIIGLLEGSQKDLDQLEKQHSISYSLGLLSKEMKHDLMANGFPYKVIISPKGEILKIGVRTTEDLEEFLISELNKNKN